MPTPPKSIDNMTKNLTAAQRQARELAEDQLRPHRETTRLKKPSWLKGAGARYWKSIMKRMEDLPLLDDLDAEILAAYCDQLQNRDVLSAQLAQASEADDVAQILKLNKELRDQDRSLLTYAERLGCTPSGRVRLAQKRAAAATDEPDGDLFGD